jgi:hypothetical protein
VFFFFGRPFSEMRVESGAVIYGVFAFTQKKEKGIAILE